MSKHPGPIERAYAGVRVVSLDVAAAALGGGIMAVRLTGSSPRPAFYWLLPAGVWVAYTTDHLLDSLRMGPTPLTPRHRFHRDHAIPIWIITMIAAAVCAIGGWIGLSSFGLIYAVAMCVLVAAHESIVALAGGRASPLLVKELGVAVVFTAGVWGMPWLRHRLDSGRWFGWPVLPMLQYLLLAIANLLLFSIFESRIDAAHGQTSFVLGIGRRRAGKLVAVALAAQLPLGAAAVWFDPTRVVIAAELIFAGMAAGLWVLTRKVGFAARFERYRTIGDGVFLLPVVMWFVG